MPHTTGGDGMTKASEKLIRSAQSLMGGDKPKYSISSSELEGLGVICRPFDPPAFKEPCIAQPGTFEWALIQMKAGKKVYRKLVGDVGWVTFIRNGQAVSGELDAPERFLVDVTLCSEALLATDWEVKE